MWSPFLLFQGKMYVHVCVLGACVCVHGACTCAFLCACMGMLVCTCASVYACVCACACVGVPVCTCASVCVCACMGVPVCMPACVCACVYVHAWVCLCARVPLCAWGQGAESALLHLSWAFCIDPLELLRPQGPFHPWHVIVGVWTCNSTMFCWCYWAWHARMSGERDAHHWVFILCQVHTGGWFLVTLMRYHWLSTESLSSVFHSCSLLPFLWTSETHWLCCRREATQWGVLEMEVTSRVKQLWVYFLILGWLGPGLQMIRARIFQDRMSFLQYGDAKGYYLVKS